MASYYKQIDGKRYDGALLDLAQKLVAQAEDGLMTPDHAQQIIEAAGDGGKITDIERDTLRYILAHTATSVEAQKILARVAPNDQRDKIKHVFVLMLENHSFDNIFGNSGIPGIRHATPQDTNPYQSPNPPYTIKNIPFTGPAPDSMTTDPGHEFCDVLQQLTQEQSVVPGGCFVAEYPEMNNLGFVENYAISTSEGTGTPDLAHIGDVMLGFHTPKQLPVIYQLATEFAICDRWHSSLPGPTWPNRFFVHGASSSGLDDSPSTEQIAWWKFVEGFEYRKGSIYDRLTENGKQYNLYIDEDGPTGGDLAQVSSIENIGYDAVGNLTDLINHLNAGKPYTADYTFIEPNYGDVSNNSYKGGSSQHPEDSMARGEGLIKRVYEAIRNSPIWDSSLLIITYDEHGGFYDSVPPTWAMAPGDHPHYDLNTHGFKFDRYGIRVPAVIVSPYIAKGVVDKDIFDHASVPATLEELWGMDNLTYRDRNARDVLHLLTLPRPRTDCPTRLTSPAQVATPPYTPPSADEQAAWDARPLPTSGNFIGWLFILLKTEWEMSDQQPDNKEALIAQFQEIKTMGQARAYFERIMPLIQAARSPKE